MNKLLQITLITAILSTSVMAGDNLISANIKIENELNINERVSNLWTLDFMPGDLGHIADGI